MARTSRTSILGARTGPHRGTAVCWRRDELLPLATTQALPRCSSSFWGVDQVHVINLARRPDRWRSFQAEQRSSSRTGEHGHGDSHGHGGGADADADADAGGCGRGHGCGLWSRPSSRAGEYGRCIALPPSMGARPEL